MIHHGDCLEVMAGMESDTFDAIVTDPPYHLTQASRGGSPRTNSPDTPFGRHRLADKGFMGEVWDGGDIAMKPETWEAALRVTQPGGYLLAFGGARTHHRMACAIEDAGWEIRDCIMWLYGTGFPKGKAQLKPAHEPIVVARKPGKLRALGVDECRIGSTTRLNSSAPRAPRNATAKGFVTGTETELRAYGRWPANVAHDGSDEVMEAFAAFGSKARPGTASFSGVRAPRSNPIYGSPNTTRHSPDNYADTGSAARFFYTAKASPAERAGARHPTIKPLSLMEWLVKLVCPPGGLVLDPFAGSGTTGLAAERTGRRYVLIEREAEYVEMARQRFQDEAPLLHLAMT